MSDLLRVADAALERATVIAHSVWDSMNDAHEQIRHDGGKSTWPAGFCTDASVLFHEECEREGIGCVYVWGRFGWISTLGDATAPHAWNELDDGTIIDLTATQFHIARDAFPNRRPAWIGHGPLILFPDDSLQRFWWPEVKGAPSDVARANVRRP